MVRYNRSLARRSSPPAARRPSQPAQPVPFEPDVSTRSEGGREGVERRLKEKEGPSAWPFQNSDACCPCLCLLCNQGADIKVEILRSSACLAVRRCAHSHSQSHSHTLLSRSRSLPTRLSLFFFFHLMRNYCSGGVQRPPRSVQLLCRYTCSK